MRFIALGDGGKGNANQLKVGRAMATVCAERGCDFVLLLGDNFYPSGVSSTDDPQWETAFATPYADVGAPFYAVMGNHDYGANGLGTRLERSAVEVAYSKVDPRWRMPAPWYTWRWSNADFFAADTTRSVFMLDDPMRADLTAWLSGSTARWKVAFGHHPLLNNGKHGNAGSYEGARFVPFVDGAGVKAFVEDVVCGRADLYLAGHDHSLQWLEPTCTRPGSDTRTELLVSGGGSTPTGIRSPPRNPVRWESGALGFVYVEIDGDTLTGTFYDAEVKPQYSRTLRK